MSMLNYRKLDNGYFNYYMWGLAGDPVNRVIFCCSQQGSKIYAFALENLSTLWSKNVSGVKSLVHDHENQILYYVSNSYLVNAIDSTNGNSLGTLDIASEGMSLNQLFNSVLVDDNSRLVILQSYVSSATTNCVMTIDVSDPTNMSVDATQALDIYNGDQIGMEWDAKSQILWVNAYYDSSVFGLTQSGSGWVKSYTISAGASSFGMTVAKGLDAVIVGTSGELQIWDVSNPSSPSKVYAGTGNERKYALAFDETEKFAYGTRIPYGTSWGIGNWDLSSSISSPTFTQLANLGTPYTTFNQFRSYIAIVT